jgi:hypothetical protein
MSQGNLSKKPKSAEGINIRENSWGDDYWAKSWRLSEIFLKEEKTMEHYWQRTAWNKDRGRTPQRAGSKGTTYKPLSLMWLDAKSSRPEGAGDEDREVDMLDQGRSYILFKDSIL